MLGEEVSYVNFFMWHLIVIHSIVQSKLSTYGGRCVATLLYYDLPGSSCKHEGIM